MLCDSEAESLFLTPPLADVSPASGVLSYPPGVREGTFTVHSLQDIEEEGNEVFSVTLVATTGGATLSIADSRTTLTGNVDCVETVCIVVRVLGVEIVLM